MKNSIAISVQNVSKKYKLYGSQGERFWEALHPFNKTYHREFWALKDISFDVHKGMTLGIIGRNGSGKSTLLQIICSILQPTSGAVTVDGRISALLELGAGFNQEFTGQQNVLMNGRVAGFSKVEMQKRIPLIEAFADIGEFFFQPVKTYSTGMFVRLAFAAAINVDPEILIVDEALAVGDARFQHKCYQKFLEFQEAGKTIILVTHDRQAIAKHCSSAVLLEEGKIVECGDPNDVINHYDELLFGLQPSRIDSPSSQSMVADTATAQPEGCLVDSNDLQRFLKEVPSVDNCVHHRNYNSNEFRFGDGRARVIDCLVVRDGDYDPESVNNTDIIDLYIKIQYYCNIEAPTFGIKVNTVDGVMVYGDSTVLSKLQHPCINEGEVVVMKFSLRLCLRMGDYFFGFGVGDRTTGDTQILDGRFDMLHLVIKEQSCFDGIADLEMKLNEVNRITDNVPGRQLSNNEFVRSKIPFAEKH